MKRMYSWFGIALSVTVLIGVASAPAMAAEASDSDMVVTVVGIVTDDYELIADDDQVYEIGYGEKNDELAEETGRRVKVKGRVGVGDDGERTIDVISYTVIDASKKADTKKSGD